LDFLFLKIIINTIFARLNESREGHNSLCPYKIIEKCRGLIYQARNKDGSDESDPYRKRTVEAYCIRPHEPKINLKRKNL